MTIFTAMSLPKKSDWVLVALYWAMAIPFFIGSNISEFGLTRAIIGTVYAIVLDTSTAFIIVLFIFPYLLKNKRYFSTLLLILLLLLVTALLFLAGYGIIYYKGNFSITPIDIFSSMIAHAQSYGILAMLLAGKNFFDIQVKLIRTEKEKVETELKFLKAQINPHFLFNTLNNIYSLVISQNPRAGDVVIKLSDMMRYTLYESNTTEVPLEKELQFLSDYINLEKIRHDEHTRIDFEVTGDAANKFIAPLILITFVENAFKHGINASRSNRWAVIKIIIGDEDLHFIMRNNKGPANDRAEKKAGGIGIRNAIRRIELLYPQSHTLTIADEASSYAVNLTLRLHGKTS